jgi:iron complex outermembrane receptor protein
MKLTNGLLGASAVLSSAMLLQVQQANAQSASAQALLEEVVVTARRREESLQDLPLSIAALSADAMQAQGIMSIDQVGDFVPNVTLKQSERKNNTRIYIRGIGGGHPDPVFVFGSGMYIDGHYIPNSLGGYMSTMDIERVELLRGPQGTLFGKNVTGGAVNIVSAKPGPDFDASLTLRTAEQGDNDLRAMINVPLAENLFMRVGLASETFDGYYYNRHLGKTVGAEDLKSASLALRATPGDWTLDLSTHIIRKRDDNAPGQCQSDGTRTWTGGGPYSDPTVGNLGRIAVGFQEAYRAACNADAAQGLYVNSSDVDTFSNIDNVALFASAQWDSNGAVGAFEELSFRANASYRYNDYDYIQDRDMTFYAIDHVGTSGGTGNVGQDNWTRGLELIFEGQLNDRTEITAGFNYFYELAKNGDGLCRQEFENSELSDFSAGVWDAEEEAYVFSNAMDNASGSVSYDELTCSSFSGLYFVLVPQPRYLSGGGPAPFLNQSRVENESYGLFTHMTYQISDTLTLDAGVRYTKDDRNFWNFEWEGNTCIAADNTTRVLGGTYTPSTQLCSNQNDPSFAMVMNPNMIFNGGMFNKDADSYTAVTPMVSLSYNLPASDMFNDALIYATYSQGFLTGGFNTESPSYIPELQPFISFEPEYVDNYELGFKGTLADGRVRINGDVFIMDYTDKQESVNIANPIPDAVDPELGIVTNAASASISGVELEVRAALWDGGFVSVDHGQLSNEYDEFKYIDPVSGELVDNSADPIADSTPDSTLNIGIEHQFDLGDGSTLTPRLNIYSQGSVEYRTGADNRPGLCLQPEYTKVGARVTYVPAGANWQASVFGQNITDERILESCSGGRSAYYYRHERPAYWGLEFVSRWGAGAN